jgi:type IV pilus assembly protein PilM
LDIGSSAVKAVELKGKGGEYELANVALNPLDPRAIVEGAIVDAGCVATAIETLFAENKIESTHIATSVAGDSVIVKRIRVAAADEEELALAVQQEALPHIRFDPAEATMTYYVLGPLPGGDALDVLLLAVKREKIESSTGVLARASKVPMVVDIDAFAVQNAFEHSYEPPPDQVVGLVNIGASMMNVHVTRGGLPLATRDVPLAGNHYTDILQQGLGLSFENAEKVKMGMEDPQVQPEAELPYLRSVTERVVTEVRKSFEAYRQTSPDPIQAIYLSGGSARIRELPEALWEAFAIPVEVLDPFRKIHCDPAKFDPKYIASISSRMTVAVGLALRSFDPS